MTTARASRDINVLTNLDVTIGAQNCQPPISPRGQAIGSEPVIANVSRATVATQDHISEVFEIGMLRIMHITGLRCHDVRLCRAGEKQELISLVRADITKNSPVAFLVPEPIRT